MAEKKDKNDKLSQNYEKMDETGKEKLREFSEDLFRIWSKKNSGTMSAENKNMWAILIAVLKNRDKNYDCIDEILPDICDIRLLIDKLEV